MNESDKILSLGICIGASTVTFVNAEKGNNGITVTNVKSLSHEGNPKKLLKNYFSDKDSTRVSVAATGRKFKNILKARNISEPEAIEQSIKFLGLDNNNYALASLGAENFMVYCINDKGSVENVLTGNKCASGTGEFFLQQIGRMNLPVEEAVAISDVNDSYPVSGRCSVFCKSDCTHALNKGVNKSRVVSGLSKMLADKAIELLSKQKNTKVLIIGGVSRNNSVVEYIKKKYPDTSLPEYSDSFEALGAALEGLKEFHKFDSSDLFHEHKHRFSFLEPLSSDKAKVVFKKINRDIAENGDECILGLDVGSTTTKAVLIRTSDNAMAASVYLRTNGNPVEASIECYRKLQEQITARITITGLGVTGSGRLIASLHALTDGDVNEIIAHAVAAAHFDKDVDTIFEIGGQDAKYTHLTNGIASDYAMNEACSAGTGSFLEEAAKESLNIKYTEIGDAAFLAHNPINFNDQCAAFISSDIKNAGHEGAHMEDIVAGLVYSICLNYVNRVKGNRPVGKKVFMQGGVCYNRAVPYAMSLLTGKEIIVPPEPGLMGAFGVALEIKNRINLGIYKKQNFILADLINRKFEYSKSFSCSGGKEKCDLKCSISMIEIEGKKYPFGGACNRYYNERHNLSPDTENNNYVKIRQNIVFEKYLFSGIAKRKRIGITKSLLTNSLYPFYHNFFTKLGFEVILSDEIDKDGSDKIRSSYCYPVEVSHGFFQNLLKKNVDYIFLPHITQMEGREEYKYNRMCVFVQGETYFLKSTFRDELETDNPVQILSPIIDLSGGFEKMKDLFIKTGKDLKCSIDNSVIAFNSAVDSYNEMKSDFKAQGRRFIKEVESNKDEIAFVLFGRPYNAFAKEINLNIPHKIASRGFKIIPYDFLPYEEKFSYENMYWYSGNEILSAARYVREHPQLYGIYITNFSCGPDSFIIPYFRKIMDSKPSLTLELDSHSADVGVETRIEAAIDIIRNYIAVNSGAESSEKYHKDILKVINKNNNLFVKNYEGREYSVKNNDVEVLVPSMGKFSTDSFSAVFRSLGINSRPLPVPTYETLKQGSGVATCKECLPFLLTTGSLIEYLGAAKNKNKKILFFMPHGYGPCRQGQYHVRLKDILRTSGFTNAGVISMDDESSFEDFGNEFFTRQWLGLVIADNIHDIENALNVLAVDKEKARLALKNEWKKIVDVLESGNFDRIYNQLENAVAELKKIELTSTIHEAKVVSLGGEIYVRREEYSRLDLINIMNQNGFIVKTAPITEYVYYTNYLQRHNIVKDLTTKERFELFVKEKIQLRIEKKVKKILGASGLCFEEMIDVEKTLKYGRGLISERLIGESILTVGLSLREILDDSCGIITIGPFNCIPSRFAEGILNKEMTLEGKYRFGNLHRNGYPKTLTNLPYLHIETDGNVFPQITQSKIEIFMIQANKLYAEMNKVKNKVN
ncbi:MAG: acyl-CoA dehydratase activase [Ignavibacteria bacterium]|nr:acyl-CoA dehydratase activase [Ignavibacteria bacterium]